MRPCRFGKIKRTKHVISVIFGRVGNGFAHIGVGRKVHYGLWGGFSEYRAQDGPAEEVSLYESAPASKIAMAVLR